MYLPCGMGAGDNNNNVVNRYYQWRINPPKGEEGMQLPIVCILLGVAYILYIRITSFITGRFVTKIYIAVHARHRR